MIKRSEILKSLNETCEGNVVNNYVHGKNLQCWKITCKEIDYTNIGEWGKTIVRIYPEDEDTINIVIDIDDIEWD